jgi:site-specific DNA recombinase
VLVMRAAVYLRQSSDPNDDRLAVTRQREDCVALCEQRGWEWSEYTDNDRSASNGQPRPAYSRLLADIRAGLIDAVVVWDLDRLHRRPAELEEFIDLADEKRLALATVGGDTDLSSDGGRLFARIKGAVAKAEVERKSARQKRANQQQRAAGKWLRAGHRPFGYTKIGEPLEPEASMLRQAATDVLAGRSLRSIAIAWNQQGVTTTRGNQWTNLALRQVLMNPLVAALVAHKGNVVGRGDWQPLIDEDTWRGLVAFLSDPARRPGAAFETKYQGSGVYRCGLCGERMYAAHPHGRNRSMTYVCKRGAEVARLGAPLDEYVEQLVLGWLGDPETRQRVMARLSGGDEVDVDALHSSRAALQARLDDLAALFAEGAIDASQLRRGTSELRAQMAGVDKTLAELSRHSPVADLLAAGKQLRERWDALSPNMKGKVVNEIMTVTVQPGRHGMKTFDYGLIDIEWKM